MLKAQITGLWQMKKVTLIPIVAEALGAITKTFGNYIESVGIEIITEHVGISALLGTARKTRKVLSR